jgi:tetratricopeptide (TPR) repeat protein
MASPPESTAPVPSPWFARLGQEALERGNPAEAVRLCASGVEHYPWYATGHLILGKALDALGRVAESVLALRRALAEAPDAEIIRQALRRAEERERNEFAAYVAEQREDPETGTITFEEYIAGTVIPGEGSAGFLQKQALAARQEGTQPNPLPVLPGKGEQQRIVTVTLAEIYASQEEYAEAVEAYRALKLLRPAEAGRFDERIRELERLSAEQHKPLQEN